MQSLNSPCSQAMPPTYKPSPLSFGSPRTSPFRRPESPTPSSPASTVRPATPTPIIGRPATPTTSPTKPHTPLQSPSKLHNVTTPTVDNDDDEEEVDDNRTVKYLTPSLTKRDSFASHSPTRSSTPLSNKPALMNRMALGGDAVARLPPAQVREMREGFQILDRDNDGQVNREDVVDMLTNLGQDSSASAVSQFFPPGKPQTINMPSFLNTLSILLTPLSSQQELLNAFAAFDEDDSGQIDVKELKDALLHTSPEAGERAMTEREIEKVLEGFTGRRAFGKGMGHGARGEVFRYPEFTASIMGSVDGDQKEQQDK
ncbi:MAG: hypothetical protein L6R40_004931 [Gallowayella cf. fulva]|nr:MAG: hypothetical protein L6R40_004931 [Xanthomendoza cf. fulva]